MAGKPIPIIAAATEKKCVEKSEDAKRLAYGLKWDQFPTRKLKETFQIKDGEISYLDNFPNKICKIESERYNDHPPEKENVVCKFEIYFTDSSGTGTSDWSYKIQLEVRAVLMDELMNIQVLDDFIKFLQMQNSFDSKLNDYVIKHKNRDHKIVEIWVAWIKIFKPRAKLILKKPIRYPLVTESEYYRERGQFYYRQ